MGMFLMRFQLGRKNKVSKGNKKLDREGWWIWPVNYQNDFKQAQFIIKEGQYLTTSEINVFFCSAKKFSPKTGKRQKYKIKKLNG